jgi:hypothetical protein
VRSSLDRHGILAETEETLPTTTRAVFENDDPLKWFDEGHVVAIYEGVARVRDLAVCREVGRDAARYAMAGTWHELMLPLSVHGGGTPRLAFEQFPVLWNATHKDAGELLCVESSAVQAVTELHGFPYADSQAWVQAWIGHHDALLRHLRFTGKSSLERVDANAVIRTRVVWGGALVRSEPTGGFGPG